MCASSSSSRIARLAGEGGLEVELVDDDTAMLDPTPRQHAEAFDERLSLGAAVRLDAADDDVDTVLSQPARGLEHRVGLPDAGREPEEDLELRAAAPRFRLVHALQEGVGISAIGYLRHRWFALRSA